MRAKIAEMEGHLLHLGAECTQLKKVCDEQKAHVEQLQMEMVDYFDFNCLFLTFIFLVASITIVFNKIKCRCCRTATSERYK
jgi:hypothetical protein